MTIDEFNDTDFGKGMKAKYYGLVYDIVAVNFHEALIGLDSGVEECPECGYKSTDIVWARCENCEIMED